QSRAAEPVEEPYVAETETAVSQPLREGAEAERLVPLWARRPGGLARSGRLPGDVLDVFQLSELPGPAAVRGHDVELVESVVVYVGRVGEEAAVGRPDRPGRGPPELLALCLPCTVRE